MQSRNVRPITCKLLELMDEGTLDPRTVAESCLGFMSEDDVAEMAHNYQLIEEPEDEPEEESEEDDE